MTMTTDPATRATLEAADKRIAELEAKLRQHERDAGHRERTLRVQLGELDANVRSARASAVSAAQTAEAALRKLERATAVLAAARSFVHAVAKGAPAEVGERRGAELAQAVINYDTDRTPSA